MRNLLTIFLLFFSTFAFAQAPHVDVAVTSEFAASGGVGGTIVSRNSRYGVITTVTVTTPSAGTFTCAITDICTKATHGFKTGLKVQLTTTNTLPAGVTTSTDYFVIVLTADTFSLASSLVLAQAGTPIDITNTGTGVHTITATALAGASLKLQGSMDGTTYVDLPIKATGDATKSSSITVTNSFFLTETNLSVNYVRIYYTLTAGQLSVSQISKVDRPY